MVCYSDWLSGEGSPFTSTTMLWSHRELIGTPRNIVEASLVQDVNLNWFPCQGSTLVLVPDIQCIHILKETNLILPEAGMKVFSSIEFLEMTMV